MNFDITNFQTLAANLPVEGEVCDLTHAEVSASTEINTEIVTLIQQVAATSIAEIDRLVTALQEVKGHLQEGFEYLQAFVQEHKHCGYKSPDGYRLGTWVSKQRLSRDNLSAERKERLDALGFDWDPLTTGWEKGVECLQSFVEERKHCRVPTDYTAPNGFRLGAWIRGQRQSRDTLSAERRGRLDKLGFVWNPYEADWEVGFRHLKTYKEREGDCRVPSAHK
jgi:Helicase associated domain